MSRLVGRDPRKLIQETNQPQKRLTITTQWGPGENRPPFVGKFRF